MFYCDVRYYYDNTILCDFTAIRCRTHLVYNGILFGFIRPPGPSRLASVVSVFFVAEIVKNRFGRVS